LRVRIDQLVSDLGHRVKCEACFLHFEHDLGEVDALVAGLIGIRESCALFCILATLST
jgi:hypothetical protein